MACLHIVQYHNLNQGLGFAQSSLGLCGRGTLISNFFITVVPLAIYSFATQTRSGTRLGKKRESKKASQPPGVSFTEFKALLPAE